MIKQRLTISNKDYTQLIDGGFYFLLKGLVIKSDAFKINKIILSNNFYQINATNNVLVLNDGTDHTITITPGNYTDTELLSAIQTQLTAIAATYSISLGPNTQLITIAESTPTNFILKLANSTMNKILGYGSLNLSGAATYTATNYFNNSWQYISMHSDQLTYDMPRNLMSDNRSNVLEIIPLMVNKGDWIHYEPQDPIWYPFKIEGSQVQFDFYFRDPFGNFITDMSKCVFTIELIFN